MACLKKCGYAHIPQLVKAGCKKPANQVVEDTTATSSGFPPEPASCIAEVKKLCGHCGTDMACLKKCGYAHIPQLVKAGCKKPAQQVAEDTSFTSTGFPPEP